MIRSIVALVLVLGSLLASGACSGPGEGKIAYVGGELIEGTGAPVVHDAVIIVSDGKIEAAGTPDLVSVPRGAEVVRLDGRWVIPGLIDAHAHSERWAMEPYLSYGVTSIRDVGGVQDSVLFLRTDVDAGTVTGPRLYISGAMIDGAPATRQGATEVRTANDARRAVGNRILIDVAQIKVYTRMDRRLLFPLLEEAKALATPVTAHLGKVDALSAANAGLRSIEHMSGVVEATLSNASALYAAHDDFFAGWNLFERSWTRLDSARLHRTARQLAAADVMIVPTLALHEAWAHLDDQAFIDSLDLSAMPQSAIDAWNVPDLIRRAGLRRSDFVAFRRSRPVQDLFVRLFRRSGGRIAAGSDSPNQLLAPGVSVHREMELLVGAGLTTEEALLAATREAAHLLQADSIGVIQPGGVADFLVLTADPLADITNTRKIEMIVSRGLRYDPAELRSTGGR